MAPERKPVPEVRADRRPDGRGNTPSPAAPYEVRNLSCPRCDAALWYDPAAWLYCPQCSTSTKPGTE